MAAAQGAIRLPFTAAAHRYREKFYTKASVTITGSVQDVSPPNGIKPGGYLRAVRIVLSTTTAGTSSGTPAFGNGDGPWALINQLSVTQPNGEELYGGPTFSGYHGYGAAQHSAWKLNN